MSRTTPPAGRRGGAARARSALVVCAVIVLHAALWLALPSQHVAGDGLDELAAVERPALELNRKHPGAEPAAWVLVRGLRLAGHDGPALRALQIWNGAWLTLALAAVALLALRRGGVLRAVAVALLLGGGHAALHLALDPMVFFIPPGLALLSVAALLLDRSSRATTEPPAGARGWPVWIALLACLGGMVLVDPMTAAALLPLGWAWSTRAPPTEGAPWLEPARGAGLVLLPLLATGIAIATIEGTPLSSGPFGTWTGPVPAMCHEGITGAIWATPWGIGPLAAFHPGTGIAGLAATTAALLLPATALVSLVTSSRLAGAWRRLAPWLIAAAATAAFLAWWNPNQFLFWIHPLWLLALAWCHLPVPRRRPKGLVVAADGLLLAAGGAMALSSLLSYAVPAARAPSGWQQDAERIAALFEPEDVLMLPVYPDPYIEYYGGLRTSSMMAVSMARPAELSTFEYFALAMEVIHDRGGRVFFLAPEPGEPWIQGSERDLARLDYTEADFARFEWGETRTVGEHVFREAVALRSPGEP